ncbi:MULTISPECIES: FAD-dependent monooxygenase [Hyphomicrobium]|jgi:salicylate hydroxylase|uniref:FAD-dependent monooxygenase n=1 Tax=Hyphomicrobium TaxID=81 RepID=UPI0003612880|nr:MULTISPECIES: FAD-dependent monooxygenase [Hyphomicrobium]WBT37635.1 FAD-dependent monooxygenase [Hyphomicrobium sp. DMF-1]HML41584.1 FAD-dependent monooxygenase [Hyphomicrobium zavarzinii]
MAATPLENVLIAGGGIGGLATALALAKRGICSEVLERRPAFGDDGAGIQLGPNGTRILEQLGAASFLRGHVTVPDALRILDSVTGEQLARFPLGEWIAQRHGAPYWVAHRRDLHAALLSAVEREPHIQLRKNIEVTSAHEEADEVVAVCVRGETFRGNLLIAADGAWSALRGRLFSGGMPQYTGKSAVRVVIPIEEVPEALRRTEVHLWLGHNVHVVHYPVSAGYAMALVAIFDDQAVSGDWSTPCDREWVAARTAGFAPLLRDLLGKPGHWRRWSLLGLEKPPRFSAGRMALIGDAAHPVFPFLAQGGVMALEDAVVIADALAHEPDRPAHAFKAYERARAGRVRRVAEASRTNGRIYHLAGFMAKARNLTLAHIPPETFMRRYDWLYGWKQAEDDA